MNPRRTCIAYFTVFRKEAHKILRIRFQTLVTPVIVTSLYFLVFGSILGHKIGEVYENVSFAEFVVPGIILLSIMTNSFIHVAKNLFSAREFWHNINEIVVSPTPPWVIVAGFASAGMLRGLLVGVVVAIISLLFAPMHVEHAGIILLFSLLTSLSFSLIGVIAGLLSKSLENISIINVFAITPAIYLGGVFHSLNHLSGWAIDVSKWNPTFSIINGFRYGFLGVSDSDVYLSIAVLCIATLILVCMAVYLAQRGIGLTR